MNNRWAIVKVLCTDGVERIGIMENHELNEDDPRVLLMGMTGVIAESSAIRYAESKGMEIFNGAIHDTNEF